MLIVNLSDGSSDRYDLPDGLPRWEHRSVEHAYLSRIRSVQLVRDGRVYAVPIPKGEQGQIRWSVQVDDNRDVLSCYVGTMRISMVVMRGNPPTVRIDVQRVGRFRIYPTRPVR